MDSSKFNISHHIIAIGLNVGILTFIPIILYFGLIFVSGDIGGPGNLILVPFSNFVSSAFVTVFLIFPIAVYLDKNRNSFKAFKSKSSFSVILFLFLLLLVLGIYLFIVIIGITNPVSYTHLTLPTTPYV